MERRSPKKKPAAKRLAAKATTKSEKTTVPARKRGAAAATKARPTVAAKGTATSVRVPHRAIFIDVENTSSEATLLHVLEHLQVDRKAQPTEVIAIGNWKSVGTRVARTLASLGAQLMHSAPAPGVRDWSDLWIAVNAGRWLALAAPGDQLDIVSDDRAFDAVHDAAAALGVGCNRISYRHLPGTPPPVVAPEERAYRPRRRGGRGRRPLAARPPATRPPSPPPAEVAAAPTPAQHAEAHTASQEKIRGTLARLTGGDSTRWINLDLVANALKAEGFSRPPGSPRLITRVRSIKGVELNPNGMVRLVEAGGVPASATSVGDDETTPAAPPTRRPRRRGGRRHRRRSNGQTAATPATPNEDVRGDDPPETS